MAGTQLTRSPQGDEKDCTCTHTAYAIPADNKGRWVHARGAYQDAAATPWRKGVVYGAGANVYTACLHCTAHSVATDVVNTHSCWACNSGAVGIGSPPTFVVSADLYTRSACSTYLPTPTSGRHSSILVYTCYTSQSAHCTRRGHLNRRAALMPPTTGLARTLHTYTVTTFRAPPGNRRLRVPTTYYMPDARVAPRPRAFFSPGANAQRTPDHRARAGTGAFLPDVASPSADAATRTLQTALDAALYRRFADVVFLYLSLYKHPRRCTTNLPYLPRQNTPSLPDRPLSCWRVHSALPAGALHAQRAPLRAWPFRQTSGMDAPLGATQHATPRTRPTTAYPHLR